MTSCWPEAARLRSWSQPALELGWGKAWHSQLFLAGMLVRPVGPLAAKPWSLSLGHCNGVAVVAWP
eukprot:3801018-Lingulodinium_polyedra.AAC.1